MDRDPSFTLPQFHVEMNSYANVAVLGQGWLKWVYVNTKGKRVSRLLHEIGLNKENSVVTLYGEPIPYDTLLLDEPEKGEMTIFTVSRVPPSKVGVPHNY